MDIFHPGIYVHGLEALGQILPVSKLTNLNLAKCGIGPSALKCLFEAVKGTALEYLDLSSNTRAVAPGP